ncbi:MAG: hypothetical protein OXI01_23840 [Albidovulum sp.]|nr:hypothetical protein [Albidovulum sp.]
MGRPTAGREESDASIDLLPPGQWCWHAWKMREEATPEALSVVRTRQPEIREDRSGPAGWRTGPQYWRRRATPVEGRGPASRMAWKGSKA